MRTFLLAVALLAAGCGEWVDAKPQETNVDQDGDGYVVDQDCDDNDASAHPQALVYCDGQMDKDRNCDGVPDLASCDYDGDGLSPEDGDCDDHDRQVYAGREETCDDTSGKDNDCDGLDDASDPDCAGTDDTAAL